MGRDSIFGTHPYHHTTDLVRRSQAPNYTRIPVDLSSTFFCVLSPIPQMAAAAATGAL